MKNSVELYKYGYNYRNKIETLLNTFFDQHPPLRRGF